MDSKIELDKIGVKLVINQLFNQKEEEDEKQDQTPNRKSRRISQIEILNEKTELKEIISESYHIPLNSGDLPGAMYNEPNLETWVYPASKAFRSYQYKIVRSALFENTLVTLPTGLGKTFIASAVMFNFYRWFKDGLIFFVAPTKPLVAQ